MKTYSLRIFPTTLQIEELCKLSSVRNDVWNTLIGIQKEKYEQEKKIYSKFDLMKLIPGLKNTIKFEWKLYNSKACQMVASEVYSAYQSFFTLIKKDKTAKLPYKIENINEKFHTLTFNQSGWFFEKDNEIIINKIPFKYKSKIDNIKDLNIKEIRVKYIRNKWLVDVVVNDIVEYENNLNIETKVLAIDLGIKNLGTGIDNKGNIIIIKNKSRKINKYFSKQIKNIQQKLSRKTKGSEQFRHLKQTLNKKYYKKNEQIKHTLHIQSKKLSNMNYNTIVIGDLSVKQLMTKNNINKNKKDIRKSFHQSNINMFLGYLSYKCQNKNSNLVKINEAWTTQMNCLTGKIFKTKIELNDRFVQVDSDLVIDRDLNSAINIMNRFYDNHLASLNEPLIVNINVLRNIISKETKVI